MTAREIRREAGRERVRAFLESELKGDTPEKYKIARTTVWDWLEHVGEADSFDREDEETQDFLLGECLLDLEAEGASVALSLIHI